jgi:hypothetical protein
MVGEAAKVEVLRHLAKGANIIPLPKAKVRIGGSVVHVRFRSGPKSDGHTWSFNINPNTLTADFELWICGSSAAYYLIPKSTIRQIYDDPSSYPDHTHSEIRVAEVHAATHRCTYGPGRAVDLTKCHLAHL